MKKRKKTKGPTTATSRLRAALRFTDRALDYAALLLAQGTPPARIETLLRQVRRKNSEVLSIRPPKPAEIRAIIAELTPGCEHSPDPTLLQNILPATPPTEEDIRFDLNLLFGTGEGRSELVEGLVAIWKTGDSAVYRRAISEALAPHPNSPLGIMGRKTTVADCPIPAGYLVIKPLTRVSSDDPEPPEEAPREKAIVEDDDIDALNALAATMDEDPEPHICSGCPGVLDDCFPDTISSCSIKASVVATAEKNRV